MGAFTEAPTGRLRAVLAVTTNPLRVSYPLSERCAAASRARNGQDPVVS